ncbi:MAG: hypothetical protein DBX47_00475 [Clostridiales bacterium]|nr:MAG: hypothetical protein DBX47_00475 [Clostridiales bacterium]
MKKYYNGLITVMFLLFLTTMLLLLIFLPKEDFSEAENRYLAKFPAVTAMKVAEGAFGDDFEKYLCDRFPFRGSFVGLKTDILTAAQNTEINGIYVGNNMLFDSFDKIDKDLEEKQISAINSFIGNVNAPVYFTLAPNSLCINAKNLPQNAPVEDQRKYINEFYDRLNCHTVDLCSRLDLFQNEYLYYRTDHHWTTLGSFYAYEKICEVLRVRASKITDYNITKVSDNFFGTLYSKGNFKITPDEIYKFDNQNKISLEYDNGVITNTLYFDTALSQKDKYAYFLGGNPAYLKITSEVDNDKTLVVIKDSYSHCMVPFLASSFETVYLLDLRYLNKDIVELVNSLEATQILVLYNAKTFSEDRNILKMGF